MSPFIASARLAVAAAGLLAAAALSAPSRPVVTSLWDIQGSGQWTAPKELAKGDPLLELSILPQGMIELTEDMNDGLLRQGDLLYKLTTQGGAVYCTIDPQPMIANEAKFAHTILVCLVDGNADGIFEGYYRRRAAAGIPLIFGEVPSKLLPVGTVKYEARPPANVAGVFAMRILLDSDPAKAKQLRFTYSAGDPKGSEAGTIKLSAVAEVRNGNYPQRFEVLGGFFELTGVNGGKAVVRMISPTAPYPFMVEEGTVKL
jgi:hypothetical protein